LKSNRSFSTFFRLDRFSFVEIIAVTGSSFAHSFIQATTQATQDWSAKDRCDPDSSCPVGDVLIRCLWHNDGIVLFGVNVRERKAAKEGDERREVEPEADKNDAQKSVDVVKALPCYAALIKADVDRRLAIAQFTVIIAN
jgi:hypothetical protein